MGIAMPLHWKIAPLEQMVVCVSEGVVTKDELMAYFKALEAAGAAHYRKLLDASAAECHLSADEVAELAAYAKANPGKVSFGSAGIGTVSHVCGEYFATAAGVKITHVPYKGTGPATRRPCRQC